MAVSIKQTLRLVARAVVCAAVLLTPASTIAVSGRAFPETRGYEPRAGITLVVSVTVGLALFVVFRRRSISEPSPMHAAKGAADNYRDRLEREVAQRTAELAEARERAEAANRAKSSFLANMAHEIRTPLNAVLGYAQLMLRDAALPASAKDNLAIINRSGEHLLALINNILDLSKIEAGRMELNPAAFDAAELLKDLTAMFGLRAEAKGVRLETHVQPLNAHIVTDQGKLRQVLINLLGNAVKFTRQGRIQVRASVECRAENERWLSFEVEDTGAGIASEDQARLFRPFMQTESGIGSRTGTGLGLAISREFIRLMGGDITVVSEAGKGTLFRFAIPVQCGCESSLPANPRQGRVIGLRSGGPAPRILIVDDEPHNRGWLRELLAAIGFDVSEADSGQAAIERWREWQPQLILMDIRMPGMDGLEATRAIRAMPSPEQPVVIALTASAMDPEREMIIRNGFDDFLPKPCREEDLLAQVQARLGIEYVRVVEPAAAVEPPAERPVWNPATLPPALTAALREAVLHGDKGRLDLLIAEVRQLNAQSASVLQSLADSYDYDALAALLTEAGP